MSDNIFPSISTNSDLFFNSETESLYDQLYSNDSKNSYEMDFNYFSPSPFASLLIRISQSTPKKIVFAVNNIGKKTKRGRQSTKKSKKDVHDSTKQDNLTRKTQIHFFSFVISFCNDAYKKVFKSSNKSFKNINQKNKITVNFDYTYGLRDLCIKDLLKMKISKKYTRYNEFYNEELLEKIECSSQWLDRIFQMNYLKLFSYYYNKGKPLDKIVFENEEIILSKKTKSFYDLLVKNPDFRINIIDTTKIVFLNDYVKKPFFITIRKMEEKDEFCK